MRRSHLPCCPFLYICALFISDFFLIVFNEESPAGTLASEAISTENNTEHFYNIFWASLEKGLCCGPPISTQIEDYKKTSTEFPFNFFKGELRRFCLTILEALELLRFLSYYLISVSGYSGNK